MILTNCHAVDVLDGTVAADTGIWIVGDELRAIGPVDEVLASAAQAGDAETVDLDGAHVLPGIVNLHVHFGLILPGRQLAELHDESAGALALRMASNARATLAAGVTTVRLVGEDRGVDFALRDAIARGNACGPRVYTSGRLLISTGGHGHDLPGGVEADGSDGFRQAVRNEIKLGADWIKICISGGIASAGEEIADVQLTLAEMQSVAETARGRGRKVAAHAGPPDVIRQAVECGIDTIEHGYFLDEEVAALMARHGTWLVPTVNVSRAAEFFERIEAPDWFVAKALDAGRRHWAGLQHAIAAGVPIAMGTDMMPFEPFDGTTATIREIEFYGEAGMAPIDALRAATIRAAEVLGAQERIGSLTVGKLADLIAVRGNPAEDLSALRSIELVIKDGRVANGTA